MLCVVLSTVVQSRDLKALVKRYEHNEDRRGSAHSCASGSANGILGSSEQSTCMTYINSLTFPGK